MNSDGLSYLVVIRNVELDRELWEKVKHLQKKKEKEKSTVTQSVTHITNPHPSLEHRPILTVQFSGFALMFISIYTITKPSACKPPCLTQTLSPIQRKSLLSPKESHWVYQLLFRTGTICICFLFFFFGPFSWYFVYFTYSVIFLIILGYPFAFQCEREWVCIWGDGESGRI